MPWHFSNIFGEPYVSRWKQFGLVATVAGGALLIGCSTVSSEGAVASHAPADSELSPADDFKQRAPAPAEPGLNPWAGRSGQAEALADIAKGQPIKLYYQGIAGERLEMRAPGLSNCHPDRYDVPEDARSKFVPLGADYSESILYTQEELARFDSATLFARAYNVTLFRMKRDEVLKICPAATLE